MNLLTVFKSGVMGSLLLAICLAFFVGSVDLPRGGVPHDPGYEVTPRFFKFASFGFWTAAVDALWIQTLQEMALNPGEISMGRVRKLVSLARLEQDLDPGFYESYAHNAVVLGMDLQAGEEAIEILDRGIRVHESGVYPKGFWDHALFLHLLRGYIHAFVLGDFGSARMDYLRASEMPGAPLYLQGMKSWLKEEGSDRKLAVRVLKVMILNTSDVDLKKRYEAKLKAYES